MTAPVRPVVLLATEKGRTFAETGLVVLRESHGLLTRERTPDGPWSKRDIDAVRVWNHESVHFLQSITCGSLVAQSLRYLDACVETLREVGAPEERHRETIEQYRAGTWDRLHEPGKGVHVVDNRQGVLLLSVPPEQTISVGDILEGMAELAAFQRTTTGATANDYVRELNERYGEEGGATYWNTFQHLASEIGPDGAYESLCPLSFAALNAPDPAATFVALARKARELGSGLADVCSDVESLFELADGRLEDHFAFRLGDGDRAHRHPTLTPILEHALQDMEPKELLQYAANPAALAGAPAAHVQALHPPIVVMSSDRTGKVTTQLTGLAANDRDFATSLIHLTALCGAAERLLFPTVDRYQFCPHGGCEHRPAGLCFRYFTPPSVERGHDQCQFPVSFAETTGTSPRAAWAEQGLERKSVDELVAEFEATGEAGLLGLVRRQKASIVAWLGRDGFEDLEWKCEATANKAARAMQTNKIDHLIEARLFRDAVVREVIQRAAESKQRGGE